MELKELQDKLAALKKKIKPLAAMKALTVEQADELKGLLDEAEGVEAQIKATQLTADEPDEIDAKIDARLAKLAGEKPAQKGGVAVPNVKKASDRGDDNSGMKGMLRYLRTGDKGAVDPSLKANVGPLEEGNNAEGAYLMPPDFLPEIIAKRDELSIARMAGARVLQTDLKVLDIPVEDTKQSNFVITAEENAADEDEPGFNQVAVTVYRWTKLIKASVELLADEKANLTAFLQDSIGRAQARTENQYILTGSGSGQPQGAITGGTLGVSLAATAAIAAGEVIDLKHSLPAGYLDGAVYCMAEATLGKVRQLGTSTFRWYEQTPAGVAAPYRGQFGSLEGSPVFISSYINAIGSGNKPMLFGNFNFYGIVERQALVVQRLTELYAANGQVGMLWAWRWGGAVLQAEAFNYAKNNTT